MAEQRQRSGVFGEAVEAYESARPDYPDELVSDVLAYAAQGREDASVGRIVEVGAGTGKASVAFAARGLKLTSIEADPRMAEALTRNCGAFPDATVVVSRFEDWPGVAGGADLLFSAQAWHWVDPATRWDRAAAILRPGGAVAVWWNNFSLDDAVFRGELQDVHARHGVPELAEITLGRDDDPRHVAGHDWPYADLTAHPGFHDVEHRAYERAIAFTARRYTDLLQSLSSYRILEDDARSRLLEDLTATVEAHGDEVVLTVTTNVYLARTLDTPAS
ncbi:class I SAM-dependent methyltransferase [Actinospica durhamensis]|uniref:Class I SAM-dependent methyltransferase n=1 Tax=Actinospica durhamensis TaxID=1508375 RepID=A0A941IPT9_9ACTN|nr:class I SAM-dependent methyltransferase [Actinospica durhamensis]MBR7836910.1 class I SAM-dependent methyltransferase [Actinospica durhamensis]